MQNPWCSCLALLLSYKQSTLRQPEVCIRAIHFNVNTRFLVPMRVNCMHAMHVGLKTVHVYVWM